jgi:hypothetical protein
VTIQIQTETIELAPEMVITVSEATWSSEFIRSQLVEEAKKIEEQQKKAKEVGQIQEIDKTLGYFRSELYPLMACCVAGQVPSAEEAYALPRTKLDEWYLAVWRLNPDMFTLGYHEGSSEVVQFRDDTTITIYENRGLPSFLLRLFELEQHALDHPLEDTQAQVFQSSFYPKMAGCVNGSKIPDVQTALTWPQSELNKWFTAARRLNGDWFTALDQASQAAADETRTKKKGKRSAGSS